MPECWTIEVAKHLVRGGSKVTRNMAWVAIPMTNEKDLILHAEPAEFRALLADEEAFLVEATQICVDLVGQHDGRLKPDAILQAIRARFQADS